MNGTSSRSFQFAKRSTAGACSTRRVAVRSTFAEIANNGAVMPSESKVTLPDVYNVVRLLLRLGSTFDEIASLGFYAGKRRLTGAALKVWYETEREERAPITAVVEKSRKRDRRK